GTEFMSICSLDGQKALVTDAAGGLGATSPACLRYDRMTNFGLQLNLAETGGNNDDPGRSNDAYETY
ncbi:MAG: hypothetical protein QGH33_14380, partial [Pirellulaceae bacterium]|nr:hypothetical protein [Pirellulaceae bacterium]